MSSPTRNIPSWTSLGRTISAMRRAVVVDLGRAQLAAGVDVGAHVVAGAHPAEGGVLALVAQRLAVHQEQPHVALGRGRQVLLGDDVAVAADRVDHLVQVGHVVRPDEEDALARRSPAAA